MAVCHSFPARRPEKVSQRCGLSRPIPFYHQRKEMGSPPPLHILCRRWARGFLPAAGGGGMFRRFQAFLGFCKNPGTGWVRYDDSRSMEQDARCLKRGKRSAAHGEGPMRRFYRPDPAGRFWMPAVDLSCVFCYACFRQRSRLIQIPEGMVWQSGSRRP